jgi:hypothetical protein
MPRIQCSVFPEGPDSIQTILLLERHKVAIILDMAINGLYERVKLETFNLEYLNGTREHLGMAFICE